jgi:bacterioferritin
MNKKQIIEMLNRDLADEHAATLRYLVHAYIEGEDTPLGAGLLSRSREEMWHMHWLGMIIGSLGGEPNLKPAPYPYDPSNRATIFKSYVEYEEKLIPHYNDEAEMVNDPHMQRVLRREAWESAIHARKFQRVLDKLKPEMARVPPGGERSMPEDFIEKLQKDINSKYAEMLKHVRHSWVFQKRGLDSWTLMNQAFEKMKHIAHLAEDVGGEGVHPRFNPATISPEKNFGRAVGNAVAEVQKAYSRHRRLKKDEEFGRHGGMVINMDLDTQQEEYQAEELKDMMEKK